MYIYIYIAFGVVGVAGWGFGDMVWDGRFRVWVRIKGLWVES